MRMFNNLELIKEIPNIFLKKTKPLKIYRSVETSGPEKILHYRYHFGFPEEVVKPLCPLLETTIFWGEQHWKEDNGYWLWWLPILESNTDYPKSIEREYIFKFKAYVRCYCYLRLQMKPQT